MALWSGEAEYYALVKAVAEGLGIKALMADLGWYPRLRVWVDSSAAKSVASRIGLGKIRHLEVKFLWLQQVVKAKKVELRKIAGIFNPADVLTKPESVTEMKDKLHTVGATLAKRCRSRWADLIDDE